MDTDFKELLMGVFLSSRKVLLIAFACLLLIYGASGFYSISQNEIGVHVRLGKMLCRTQPGIHYALPAPFDRVYKVPVKTMKKIDVNDFTESFRSEFNYLTDLSSYCITGDNNIVNIKLGVQYSILEPEKYLFNSIVPDETLLHIICNSVIKGLATIPVDKALTYGKKDIENFVKRQSQEMIDKNNIGIQISFVELESITPPKKVQKYFDDVINAKIDMKKIINKSESYKNEMLPEAKGAANYTIQGAYSYKDSIVSIAEGDSARFLDVLKTYGSAKDITKRRLYLENMKALFSDSSPLYLVSTIDGKATAQVKIMNPSIQSKVSSSSMIKAFD